MNDEKIAVSKKYLIFLQRQSWRLIITMQAAYIDHHQGADDAIKWIVKTLMTEAKSNFATNAMAAATELFTMAWR